MKETTEFNYRGTQLRYNKETGHCWKQRKSGEWALITPGTLNKWYTCLQIGTRNEQLHRIIAEVFLTGGKLLTAQRVDHIEPADGSHAQDRLSNLRIASHGQNLMNRGINRNNKSGYKGVAFHKSTGKWQAQIMSGGRFKYLGCFTTPEAAALAYDKAAKELHGEFARLNFSTGSC
jgi:hypothetical protein